MYLAFTYVIIESLLITLLDISISVVFCVNSEEHSPFEHLWTIFTFVITCYSCYILL